MRTAKILLVACAVLLLSGCIEIVHFVDRQDGQLQARYRVTFSKSVIDFMQQLGEDSGAESEGPSDQEIEQNLEEGARKLRNALPEGTHSAVDTINTDHGFGIDVTVARGSADADAAARWVPTRFNGELTVPLFPADEGSSGSGGSGEEGSLSRQGGDAVLAGRHYRVLISAALVPESPAFHLRLQNGESDSEVTGIRFEDVYLIEIPMTVWMSSERMMLVARSEDPG